MKAVRTNAVLLNTIQASQFTFQNKNKHLKKLVKMVLLASYVLNKTVLRNELRKNLRVLDDKPFLNGSEYEFATIQSLFHHLPISYVKTQIIQVHKTIILPLFVRCET
jgi:hypothetical protein